MTAQKSIMTMLVIVAAFLLPATGCSDSENSKYSIFDDVCDAVQANFFDPALLGHNWEQIRSKYRSNIKNAKTDEDLFRLLNQMLFELNVSHMGVGRTKDLQDKVSAYIWSSGSVGIDVRLTANELLISRVEANSPAALQGIKTGYSIAAINGITVNTILDKCTVSPPFNQQSRKFAHTEEVLRTIYGNPDQDVKIDYLDADKTHSSVTLTRRQRANGTILFDGFPQVFLENEARIVADGIAYIRFNAFQPSDLAGTIDHIEKFKIHPNMILDLRGNNGGSTQALMLLASHLLKQDRFVYMVRSRTESDEFIINQRPDYYRGKLVVLVDELSISAAELLADILQHSNSAQIVGAQTPGKVLSGELFTIQDTVSLLIPIAQWLRDDGFSLENTGVTPDHQIELNKANLLANIDTQLHMAIKVLQQDTN